MIKITKVTQEQIKMANKINVLSTIRYYGSISKQELSRKLSVSIPTVTSNVNELKDEGLIYLGEVAESTGGRRPVIINLAENSRFSVGVCINIEETQIMVMNLKGDIIEKRIIVNSNETMKKYEEKSNKKFSELLDDISCEILNLVKKYGKDKLIGVGMSLPGTVDDENKILIGSVNLNLENYDFKEFEEKLGCEIYIENEANIGAFAEFSLSGNRTIKDLVYFSITDGIGTGIIIDGKIYKGNTKKAGEFGHIRISDRKVECNCGKTGCLEMFASNDALIRIFEENSSRKVKSISEIFNLYMEGDEDAIKTIVKYSEYINRGVEMVDLTINPNLIMLGGEVARYKSILSKYIDDKVVFSSLCEEASVIGASMLPYRGIVSF